LSYENLFSTEEETRSRPDLPRLDHPKHEFPPEEKVTVGVIEENRKLMFAATLTGTAQTGLDLMMVKLKEMTWQNRQYHLTEKSVNDLLIYIIEMGQPEGWIAPLLADYASTLVYLDMAQNHNTAASKLVVNLLEQKELDLARAWQGLLQKM